MLATASHRYRPRPEPSRLRILLLHPNFPGQFRQRALHWAAAGHDVRFLCQTHYGRELPGVHRICLKREAGHQHLEGLGLKGVDRSLKLAKQYLSGFQALADSGLQPDLILSHTGWGCGLHAHLAFPRARQIGYVEWWFQPGGVTDVKQHRRNLAIALEAAESELLVAPTRWQRAQLPPGLAKRCEVIGDGVDTEWFQPAPQLKAATPLLTYGTRGMEPTRGFPEFINALPALLNAVPELEVEIAGEDRICYAGQPPKGYSGYGAWAQRKLARWDQRVRFVGVLGPEAYRRWLQRSWIHLYLTRPFVASWSLLEAMASGCCLIASNSEPVKEFTGHQGALMVDPWSGDPDWLKRSALQLLAEPQRRQQISAAARKLALAFRLSEAHQMWGHVLGQGLTTLP